MGKAGTHLGAEARGTTVRHMRTFLGRHTADEIRAHYDTFVAPYFTTDGQADLAVADTAVTTGDFYRTATTS
jgi:hypothetical protein